jgi:hypothetical protein
MYGGGFAFRAFERVDLSAEILRGAGNGIAPWAVSVKFLVLSVGSKYQGRAATPIAQMAADATTEIARSIYDYIQSLPVDPFLDERCMLLDDNFEPLLDQPVGTRTADGEHCLVQGEKLRMHEHWYRDKKKSVVCRDEKFKDCLMYRRPDAQHYRVLHRPWVGEDCVPQENVYDPSSPNTEPGKTDRVVKLAVMGALSDDKASCTDGAGHVYPVGKQYYREDGHRWICEAPRIEEQADSCFMALQELPQKMQNQVTDVGRLSRAYDHGLVQKAQNIDRLPGQVVDTAQDVADGRITIQTIKEGLRSRAQYIAEHATLEDAKAWLRSEVADIQHWVQKPAIEQGEDIAKPVVARRFRTR